MKFLAVILLFISSVSFGQVGAKARYKVTVGDLKVQQSYEEILEVTSFDKKKKEVNVRETQLRFGSVLVNANYVTSLVNLKRLQSVYKNCLSERGFYEIIEIGNKSIQACAMPVNEELEEGVVWYGETPFGILKKQVQVPGTKVLRTRELLEASSL